jgi:hypothetical protein
MGKTHVSRWQSPAWSRHLDTHSLNGDSQTDVGTGLAYNGGQDALTMTTAVLGSPVHLLPH